jgi:hypothetical protein
VSWWEYKSIKDANKIDFAQYYALPPDACPYCGEPLQIGWTTVAGGGKETSRNCPFGHYNFQGGRRLI